MRSAQVADNPFRERFGDLAPGEVAPVDDAIRATVPSGCLLDVLGMELTHVGPGAARVRMTVATHHLNQAGVAQAGAIVSLADAAAGWAAKTALPPERTRFSTLELNANVLRAAVEGDVLEAVAQPVHLGRTTMVISVDVTRVDGPRGGGRKAVATFRCTQMVL